MGQRFYKSILREEMLTGKQPVPKSEPEVCRIFKSPGEDFILVDGRIKTPKTCVPHEYMDTTLQIVYDKKDNNKKRRQKIITMLKKHQKAKEGKAK